MDGLEGLVMAATFKFVSDAVDNDLFQVTSVSGTEGLSQLYRLFSRKFNPDLIRASFNCEEGFLKNDKKGL